MKGGVIAIVLILTIYATFHINDGDNYEYQAEGELVGKIILILII